MPQVDSNTDLGSLHQFKGVRVNGIFYYSDLPFAKHDAIARDEAGVTEIDGQRRPIVEDAGYFRVRSGKLTFEEGSTSTSFQMRDEVRNKSNEILRQIQGERSL